MRIELSKWESINTADLTPEERHILQKLVLWESSVASMEAFQTQVTRALAVGWNGSGPVGRSRNLDRIILALEEKIQHRLAGEG
ncbi:MAG: hypothetical protein MI747_16675 [Desulfobacterales bacterium]|nr:hypothetical protein [Desulfobacterales bacterium]